MKPCRLTEAAAADVADILRQTRRQFGPVQQETYARIIEAGTRLVAEDPCRGGARERAELARGLRSFHLELAAGRLGGASHVLYYLDEPEAVIIVRILHERMDPDRHLP
ncbi:MAG: type II toxin-antitoxin system RelE/ParE family toxin [Solirubrobacterales bacterium]